MNSKVTFSSSVQNRLIALSNGFHGNIAKKSAAMIWAGGYFWGLVSAFLFWFLFFSKAPW